MLDQSKATILTTNLARCQTLLLRQGTWSDPVALASIAGTLGDARQAILDGLAPCPDGCGFARGECAGGAAPFVGASAATGPDELEAC